MTSPVTAISESAKNFLKRSMRGKYTDHLFSPGNPVQQYLMQTGLTMFGGMQYEDIKRLQLDIETYSIKGFSKANRPEDRIIMVSMKGVFRKSGG